MFPWISHSHVNPFLELAKNLSKRGFHIYFCSTPINLDSIRNKIDTATSIDLIQLSLPSSPQLPPHFHTTKNLPPNLAPILLQAFQQASSAFPEILSTLNPDLLIYDFLQPWAAKQARFQGIPSVYFATSGAAPFSHSHHIFTHGAASPFPYQEIYLHDYEIADATTPITTALKDADEESFLFGVMDLSCEIVLIKGSKGFDGKYIEYLSELSKRKVVATGPLVGDQNEDKGSSEILQWLSTKEAFSTVFICFGSENLVSMEQIQEIARGLELCEANFVWVVRLPTKEDALPKGFVERVKGKGVVVEGWAAQAKILRHPSIGGFVSQCGWSSIMESVYMGVPVIGMPAKYDQPINARLVVDAGVGVEVVRCENGWFSGEEVAKAIDKVIFEKGGEEMRERARQVSERMKEEEGATVNEAVDQILLLCNKTRQNKLKERMH